MTNSANPARLGVDIGGTFTDAVLEASGRRFTTKVLTTTAAPEKGVLEAIGIILQESEIEPGQVGLVIHGTTLATNALIERKGARTALVTTEGHRDVLQIRLEHRFEQYDVFLDVPEPLVPRHLRLTVPERVDAKGRVLMALDEAAVARAADQLAELGVEAVAVGFLHSYVAPEHERRAGEILRERLPQVAITLSSDVAPEMKEYERLSTACANAYLQPAMARYLANLERDLRAEGFGCPLLLMLSGGGLTNVETSRRFPVRLVESGPAGGAIFSGFIAARRGLDQVLSFDMGGTTAKICLIDGGRPQTSRGFEVARIYRFKKGSGLPVRIPVIEMVEIGAGGGSIASLDRLGRIAVGPESAGSEPGPACYGRGGTAPAVTDANVVLGRIDPDGFAGGRLRLDAEASRRALMTAVGTPLGLAPASAALGVSEIVDENMASAARVHTIESGKEVGSRTLIAFGGGAPLHATRVAEKLGIDQVLIPTSAGVGSAVGFLMAPVAYEIVRSHYQVLSRMDPASVDAVLDEMSEEATRIVREAAPGSAIEETRVAFMRYYGQGHEISIRVPVRRLTLGDREVFAGLFEEAYRRLYRRTVPGAEIELLSWKLLVSTVAGAPPPSAAEPPARTPEAKACRGVFDIAAAQFVDTPIYWRDDLRPGDVIEGPAVIAERETSTVVSAAFDARIDRHGDIECTRRRQREG